MKPEPLEPARVVVTDLDISFGHLVWLLVKVTMATVPAMIILGVLATLATAALSLLGPK